MTRGRLHGIVGTASGLIPFGHLGWGYRHRREFLRRAAEYATDGLREGHLVVFVGRGPLSDLRAELDAVRGHLGADVRTGRIDACTVGEFYRFLPGTDVVDAEASVAVRVAATEAAVAQGHTGFRAVVDATAVARTPVQREAFSRFEFLIDEQMATLPVSALCAYDEAELGSATASLVCLHPYVNDAGAPYQIYRATGVDIAVSGAVDAAHATAFADLLSTVWSPGTRPALRIDATDTTVLAPEVLDRLDAAARRDGVTLTVAVSDPWLTAGHVDSAHVRLEHTAITEAPVDPDAVLRLRVENSQLRTSLASKPDIEQCKGMLKEAFGVDDDEAFELLKAISQGSNVKLNDVARSIVDSWASDGPRPDREAAAAFLVVIRRRLGGT